MSEYQLRDDEKDVVDFINDLLTKTCETSMQSGEDVASYIEKADEILRMKGLSLDFSDIENVRGDVDTDLDDGEVVNILLPIYRADEQSEYNLAVNYSWEDDMDSLLIDMEMQYVWEEDMGDDDYDLDEFDLA